MLLKRGVCLLLKQHRLYLPSPVLSRLKAECFVLLAGMGRRGGREMCSNIKSILRVETRGKMQNTHIHKALVEKEMAGRQNGNSVPVTEKAEKKMV